MRRIIAVGALAVAVALGCSSGEAPAPEPDAPAEAAPDEGGGAGGGRRHAKGKRKAKGRKKREGGGADPVAGSWPPTIDGVCKMTEDCGCLAEDSLAECVENLSQYEDGTLRKEVRQCIVAQSCDEMCNGGGVRCIEEHNPSNGGGGGGGGGEDPSDCWPTGLVCPPGSTPIVNWCDVVVDCR